MACSFLKVGQQIFIKNVEVLFNIVSYHIHKSLVSTNSTVLLEEVYYENLCVDPNCSNPMVDVIRAYQDWVKSSNAYTSGFFAIFHRHHHFYGICADQVRYSTDKRVRKR